MRFFKTVLYVASIAMVGFVVSPSFAYAQEKSHMKYYGMDQNGDGIIARNEWRSDSGESFNNHDWNHDGKLSGNEVSPGEKKWDKKDKNHGRWSGGNYNRGHDNRGWDRDNDHHDHGTSTTNDRFSYLDRNNDGYVARDEWRRSSRTFEILDRNNDGRIDRNELGNREYVQSAVYAELDVNNDKIVSRSEWRASTEDFNRLDINGDNGLSENEFYSRQSSSSNITEQIFQMLLGNQ